MLIICYHGVMPLDSHVDFWTRIVGTAYWQVLLLFFTAFLTSWLTQLFITRRKDKERLRICKSTYRAQGYLLGQMMLSRLQDEIHSNLYETRLATWELTESVRATIEEQLKIKVQRIADAALEINEVYGKIVAQLTEIQLLTGDEAFKDIEKHITKFVNVRSIAVTDLPLDASPQVCQKYVAEETERVRKKVVSDIMMPMNDIYARVKPLRLRPVGLGSRKSLGRN